MSDDPTPETPTSDRERRVPFPSRDRVAYWFVALALFGALCYVGWRYVGTVVLGLFVYYVTRPVFERIHARVASRTLAVVVALLSVALPVLALVGWTVLVAYQALSGAAAGGVVAQLEALVAPYVDLATVVDAATRAASALVADPTRLNRLRTGEAARTVLTVAQASLTTMVNVGLHLFIVVVVSFYLLRDGYRLVRWAEATVAPPGSVTMTYLRAVDDDLGSIYFGNILNALVTGLLGVVTYLALDAVAPPGTGVPQPALLGLLVGVASLVPVVGMKIVWVPVALYLFAVSLLTAPGTVWFPVAFAVVSTVVVDYVPDQLLRPYVSGRSLHVGAVMLAYILGPLLFGWYGIFLGPLLLVVVFEFARVVFPWLVDETTGAGARVAAAAPRPDASPGGATAPGDAAAGQAPDGVDDPDDEAATGADDGE